MKNKAYWLKEKLITGITTEKPKAKNITIIGSGLTGSSCAYWLSKESSYSINLVDDIPSKGASFRNCGHILTGPVESMSAFSAIHGQEKAKEIWQFSVDCCEQITETIKREKFSCDYKKNGYLVVAIDPIEEKEIQDSIKLLNNMDFPSEYKSKEELERLGLRNTYGARFDKSCAQLHPTKFRNELLAYALRKGINYNSGIEVSELVEQGESILVKSKQGDFATDCVILATNAYSSPFFRNLHKGSPIVPFKGQIICSAPLKAPLPITYPHSFDHGYEFALRTEDNRLMIGGWRNNIKGQELGKTDLKLSREVEEGLKSFVDKHYSLTEPINWDYSWAGIMAAANNSLPSVGPISPQIFACLGYTGHGASWSHNCAKLLCQIVLGQSYNPVSRFFQIPVPSSNC